MNNFLQTVNKALNRAFGNTCTLIYSVSVYSDVTDSMTEMEYERPIFCDEPKNVNSHIVDNINYLAGDLIVPVDYLALIDTRQLQLDEPENLFTELKPFDISTGGIQVGQDKIKISSSDIEYKIMKVTAVDWIGAQPAAYELVIRR